MKDKKSIIMLGASGAVGGHVLATLLKQENIECITLLGRKNIENISAGSIKVEQHVINIFEPDTYVNKTQNHEIAVCTLGVGEPSKMGKEDFIKIDKIAVLNFAKACKNSGVKHFELLSSVSSNSKSSSFYLRIKGELIEALQDLNFERLSIFQPSMILTPKNRYGLSQAIILKIWPWLTPILAGSARKYRGIKVEHLGLSIALNALNKNIGIEILHWDDFNKIIS